MAIVKCANFQCSAVLESDGVWRDAHHQPLEVVIVVAKLLYLELVAKLGSDFRKNLKIGPFLVVISYFCNELLARKEIKTK
jgi:hypothetical protein